MMGENIGQQISLASSPRYVVPVLGLVRRPGWLVLDLISVLTLQSNASLGKILTWCVHLHLHYANAGNRAGQLPHQRLMSSRP